MAVNQQNALDLAQPDEGKAPKMRIESADKAATIVSQLVDANQQRAFVDNKVKYSLDGGPPFDAGKLKAANQSNRTNVSFREAEGIHDAAITPYYDLFAEAPCYCEVNLGVKGPEHAQKSRITTEEFNYMLRSYDGFDYVVQLGCANMVDYGKGFVMWPDDENWQPDWVKHSKVLVPDMAPASLDKLELMIVRESWPLHKLWNKVRDKDSSRRVGWNAGAVAQAMRNAVPDSQQAGSPTDDYEYWQQKLRNNDICESLSLNSVKAAHVLVKEFNGKITHLIVEETGNGQQKIGGPQPTKKFMYKKVGRFESFRQVVGVLFYDLGDGTWHSVKGLLVKMYNFVELKNRTNCALVDNMFLNMSVLVKVQNRKEIESLGMLHIGPMTVLPPGAEPVQWGLSGAMKEALAVDQHLDNKLQANIGTYRQPQRREVGNPDTATKERIDAAKEAMLSKGAVNRFYSQMDFIYEEMYRRASNPKLLSDTPANKMAKEFQARCAERGVTVKELANIRSVRAYRNLGNGSVFMRQQAMVNTAVLVPMLNEQGRQNWIDDAIAVNANYEMVERWNPRENTDPKIQQDEVTAALQIGAAKEGVPPVITDLQNHIVFADKFISAAAQSIQSIQGGANPVDVLAFLDVIMPAALKHLQAIQQDGTRKQAYKLLMDQWKKIAQLANQLHQQVAQMQQQRQQQMQRQQQVMSDEQLDQLKTTSDIQRKNVKAANDMRLKGIKTRQQLAIADVKLASDIRRENALDQNGSNGE